MKKKIIQAIKDFNIVKLAKLLDDDKSYMDVTKSLFLSKLEEKFIRVKEEGYLAFDEVCSGVCNSCYKDSEGVTFLSKSGFYLDLIIVSKDGNNVIDMYQCHKFTNFINLDKKYPLSIHFYEDEKVNFQPDAAYRFVEEELQVMLSDITEFQENLTYDDFVNWYNSYAHLRNLDFIEITILKLYTQVNDVIQVLNTILEQNSDSKNILNDIKKVLHMEPHKIVSYG